MAFIANDQEEEPGTMDVLAPGETAPGETTSGTQPVQLTKQATTTGATTDSGAATAPSQGTGSGQFTNIREYIEANRGATEKIAKRLVTEKKKETAK